MIGMALTVTVAITFLMVIVGVIVIASTVIVKIIDETDLVDTLAYKWIRKINGDEE